jgi:hypothetical protein
MMGIRGTGGESLDDDAARADDDGARLKIKIKREMFVLLFKLRMTIAIRSSFFNTSTPSFSFLLYHRYTQGPAAAPAGAEL